MTRVRSGDYVRIKRTADNGAFIFRRRHPHRGESGVVVSEVSKYGEVQVLITERCGVAVTTVRANQVETIATPAAVSTA